jgi:hypothetical protein
MIPPAQVLCCPIEFTVQTTYCDPVATNHSGPTPALSRNRAWVDGSVNETMAALLVSAAVEMRDPQK